MSGLVGERGGGQHRLRRQARDHDESRERKRRGHPQASQELLAQGLPAGAAPTTSTPGGGVKLKVPSAKRGLRSMFSNSRRVVWPRRSTRRMRRRRPSEMPTASSRKSLSELFGVRRVHARPSSSPPSVTSNSAEMSDRPDSSSAGVPISVSAAERIVTWARSASYSQTVTPSETMSCSGSR